MVELELHSYEAFRVETTLGELSMKNRILFASFVTFASMLFASAPAYVAPKADVQDLLNKRISFEAKDATVLYVVGKLAIQHRIPVGFEQSSLHKDKPNINIELVNGTVGDVLHSIVIQAPIYTWEVNDDVINVLPKHGRDELLETLLSTHVKHFAPKSTDKFQIRDAVLDLSEVRALLANKRVQIDRFNYPVARSIFANDEVDLSLSDTDVRRVLNKVVKESEHKLWILERVHKTNALRLGF